MDPKVSKIDRSDWVKSGEGAIGASYFHKDDPTLMLKININDAPLETWENEIRCAEALIRIGLPTPKPGCIVTDGEHYGLMFQRISGKVSYARATGEQPENIVNLAKSFAGTVRLMHSTVAKIEGVRNVKDFIHDAIDKNIFHDESFKKKAHRLVDSLPDADKAIHGDLHFGNIIMADGKDYIIDIGNFCYGYYMFDLAMFDNVIGLIDHNPELFTYNYHCTPEQALLFYRNYINEYFGKEVDLEAFSSELLPYKALRFISMENEMGRPLRADALPIVQKYIDSLPDFFQI